MTSLRVSLLLTAAMVFLSPAARADSFEDLAKGLAPHKAVYDIDLIATHSGSQILNISGQMTYEWKPSCDAWLTDHRFKLYYEYADSPGMRIASDFSTYETADGKSFNFTSRRKRDGEMYQEVRGLAELGRDGGKATYSMPPKLQYDLKKGSYFPITHTLQLIKDAQDGKKFFNAEVFDGSDEDGPIEINTFIGRVVDPKTIENASPKVDAKLLDSKAWNVRMAVFPVKDQEEESDYEMSMVFHENGIISDMTIEYDDFTVKQKLVSLESVPAGSCDLAVDEPKKP